MEAATILSAMTAVVGGVVTVVTALIENRTKVALSRLEHPQNNPPTETGRALGAVSHKAFFEAESLNRQRITNWAAFACGALLLAWSMYLMTQLRELRRGIEQREAKFALLRESFAKSEGVTFNPINVKSDYVERADATPLYSLWIEASDEVLDEVDHVKYVFSDDSWSGDSVREAISREDDSGKAFECHMGSSGALKYITVLVMYKGYRDNGKIQPINFHWSDEVVERE
jgi:hypothetical protein